jgi:ABC-type sugar transport system, permease component
MKSKNKGVFLGAISILVSIVIFLVPFAFMLLNASKSRKEAGLLKFTLPTEWHFIENFTEVITRGDNELARGMVNSILLTVVSVVVMTILGAMIGYVQQRRKSGWTPVINALVMAGLIIPPAVVPTFWVLKGLGLYGKMIGLMAVHVAFGLSFCVLLFKAFVSTIPRELDEAALIDGAGPLTLFFKVIFPLLKSVIVTVVVVQAVSVFNDFTFALYFLPEEPTVQLSLYKFQSPAQKPWNLVFMNVTLITIPPLIMYIFFNRQIVSGMTSGAVKG